MDLRMAFTEDAADYDRCRPAYPKELFLEIAEYTPLGKDSRALEIGIGTGQATLPILNTGCAVMAVELGRELHDYVKKKFSGHDRFEAVHADFMNALPGGNAFDLVYCATAFHWLPAGEGYRRVMDCLKPGGALALFWNHPCPNRENDAGNLVNRRIYAKYRPSGGEPVEFSERDCGGTPYGV